MVLMATLTHRSTGCLGGRLHRDAFRRYPSRGVCAAAATPDNKQTRHERPRARKPRHAAATVQPQKRALEKVVILKRGQQVVPKSETAVTPAVATPVAQAQNAEPVAATGQLGAQGLPETAAGQCGEPSEKAETAVADDRWSAPTEKAEKASTTKIKTEAGTTAEPVKKAQAVAAANRISPKAMQAEAAPTVYSGASFLVSPDPRELPMPVALLKPRGERTAACA